MCSDSEADSECLSGDVLGLRGVVLKESGTSLLSGVSSVSGKAEWGRRSRCYSYTTAHGQKAGMSNDADVAFNRFVV